MHTTTSLHSSPPHPLAASSQRIYYKAVICGHGSCHSTGCDCLQNFSSYSRWAASALVTVLVAWRTLPVNEIMLTHPCPQYQPTGRTRWCFFLLTKILPYCPSNNKYIHGNDYVDNNHCILLISLLGWINHLLPNWRIDLIY